MVTSAAENSCWVHRSAAPGVEGLGGQGKFQPRLETCCLHGPCSALGWHEGDVDVSAREVNVPIRKRARQMQV